MIVWNFEFFGFLKYSSTRKRRARAVCRFVRPTRAIEQIPPVRAAFAFAFVWWWWMVSVLSPIRFFRVSFGNWSNIGKRRILACVLTLFQVCRALVVTAKCVGNADLGPQQLSVLRLCFTRSLVFSVSTVSPGQLTTNSACRCCDRNRAHMSQSHKIVAKASFMAPIISPELLPIFWSHLI